jgi:hypothetical protein
MFCGDASAFGFQGLHERFEMWVERYFIAPRRPVSVVRAA